MTNIKQITTGLRLGVDGIWYSPNSEFISYPPEGYDSCLAVEERSYWFRHRNNCIVSIVKSYPPENNGTIFDIGGGNGYVSLGLSKSGFNVALVEPGAGGASNAKKKGIVNVICATINTANFKKNSLPAIGLFDVVEHIEDDLIFLKSVKNLLRKNGHLYVTVPSYSFLWSVEDVVAGHFRRYTLDDMYSLLKLAGFKVEFASYIFRILPIPIFFLRSLPYNLALSKTEINSSAIMRDHAVNNRIVDGILNLLLQTEISNLNKKKGMSFGSSCLVVAKS